MMMIESCLLSNRVRVDIFKGFTEEQKREIRATQAKQREEHAVISCNLILNVIGFGIA